jgi:LPS export ABC transporter permease LptF
MKIFTKYILKQFFAHTALSLMLLIFLLMMERIFQLVNMLVNKGLNLASVFNLVLYSLPTMLVISMPMAVLAGSILTFGKMASDGEVTVIRTSGNTLKPLVMPIFTTAVILTLFMFPFNFSIAPTSQSKFKDLFVNIAMKDPALRLEESTLIEITPYTLMALEVNHKKKTLGDIIIYKEAAEGEPTVSITASRGRWHTAENGNLVMELFDGNIRHQPEDQPEKLSTISFKNHTLTIQPPTAEQRRKQKSIESMTPAEIKDEISRLKSKDLPTHKVATRYYLRGSLAGAIPVLLLMGIPLGVQAERKGKNIGVGISIGVIALYYFLMVAGIKLSFNKIFIPIIGVWLPNIILGTAGIILMRKCYSK